VETKPKTPLNPIKPILVVLALLTCVLGYGIYRRIKNPETIPTWEARDQQVERLSLQLKNFANEIKSHQGQSRCQSDDDCRVVGLGSRVCNGYKDFLIYSVRDANETILLQKVRAFNSTMSEMNNLSIKVPNCGESPAPIQCKSSQCVPMLDR
jgi:hypothetical protein